MVNSPRPNPPGQIPPGQFSPWSILQTLTPTQVGIHRGEYSGHHHKQFAAAAVLLQPFADVLTIGVFKNIHSSYLLKT